MAVSLRQAIERLEGMNITLETERQIRSECKRLLAYADRRGDERIKAICRRKLRQLENYLSARLDSCGYFFEDMGFIMKNTLDAADFLLSPAGCKIEQSIDSLSFACRPGLIVWAALNLVSNAALFGSGGEVLVSMRENGERVILTVENSGGVLFSEGLAGGGIKSALNCARLHSGTLLLADGFNGRVKAAMSLSRRLPAPPEHEAYDCSRMFDDLSPVRLALCTVTDREFFV